MLKTKAMSITLAVVLSLGVFTGCSSSNKETTAPPAQTETKPADTKTTTDNTTTTTDNTTTTTTTETTTADPNALKDGSYKVEYDKFDAHGYKMQLELTVSGGKISAVKFDEVMKDGKLKSTDESYKAQMEKVTKTYPKKAYDTLTKQMVDKQSADVDTVTGATELSAGFKDLAKYAVDELAKKGNTTPAVIPAK